WKGSGAPAVGALARDTPATRPRRGPRRRSVDSPMSAGAGSSMIARSRGGTRIGSDRDLHRTRLSDALPRPAVHRAPAGGRRARVCAGEALAAAGFIAGVAYHPLAG